VDVVFHAHNAVISDRMKQRAIRGIAKVAQRLTRAVDATVRFTQDGPVRRVEVVLHAPRHRHLMGVGEARYYGPALNAGLAHLETQVRRDRRVGRKQKAARATRP
jgi:ribosome-associated translation inhibitor RaiA